MIFKNNFLTIHYSMDTDQGLKRSNNEDSADMQTVEYRNENEFLIAALADGVGGMPDGEIASRESVSVFIQTITEEIRSGAFSSGSISSIRKGMIQANSSVLSVNRKKKSSEYMASTLTTFVIHDKTLSFANSGDSELMLYDGKLRVLSEVHREIFTGYLTSCIGVDRTPEIFTGSIDLHDRDMILLSSDGLTDMVSEQNISAVLSNSEKATDELITELKEAAFSNGGIDNITMILCRVEENKTKKN